MTTCAIVLGLTITGLGVVRSLGARGVPVIGVYTDKHELGRLSRWCTRTFCWAPHDASPAQLLDLCQQMSRPYDGRAVIYPTSDDFVELLAKAPRLRVPMYPAIAQTPLLLSILDKLEFAALTQQVGFCTPSTQVVSSLDTMLQVLRACKGKIVVKPRVSHRSAGRIGSKAHFVRSEQQAKEFWKTTGQLHEELVLQELIEDSPTGIVVYLGYRSRDGARTFGCTGRKLRQVPIHGGTASCVRLEPVPGLSELSERFVTAIDYRGLFGLEFKWDPDRNQFSLIDMSARTELFHSVAEHAGLNLPHLCYVDCIGGVLPQLPAGRRSCWIRVEHECAALKRNWQQGVPLHAMLRQYRGSLCLPVLAASDPLPFLGYCADVAGRTLRAARALLRKVAGPRT